MWKRARLVPILLQIWLLHTAHVNARGLRQFNSDTADSSPAASTSGAGVLLPVLDAAANAINPGWTALHYAVSTGNDTWAETLIFIGADVDATNDEGFTPLHFAAQLGSYSTAKLLLDSGADVNAASSKGASAITIAAFYNQPEVARLLLDKGADPNHETTHGETALIFTGSRDAVEIAGMLVNAGAKIDHKDGQGETPLHEMVMYGAEKTARFLLEKGADLTAKDNLGRVPADVVCLCTTFVDGILNPCEDDACTESDKKRVEDLLKEATGWSVEDSPTSGLDPGDPPSGDTPSGGGEEEKMNEEPSPPPAPKERPSHKLDDSAAARMGPGGR